MKTILKTLNYKPTWFTDRHFRTDPSYWEKYRDQDCLAVPYDELKSAGWEEWFGQLRCFDGVHFLQKGVVLSEELRGELSSLNAD